MREHYYPDSGNEKRIPFMNCAMICGEPHIWPRPTIKTTLGGQSLTFDSSHLKLDVITKFSEAKHLLMQAYELFIYDLKESETKETGIDNLNGEENNEVKKVINYDNNSNGGVEKYCDIKRIDIRAEISTIPEVFHHLDMDESYELNITSELACTLIFSQDDSN